mmetsp:Transcript_104344/g.300093  ORF Transcript_104344/g.300093 Transcript_104344/m.300093 type:complete len:206 (-) Transcript_104344:823-1440(-)
MPPHLVQAICTRQRRAGANAKGHPGSGRGHPQSMCRVQRVDEVEQHRCGLADGPDAVLAPPPAPQAARGLRPQLRAGPRPPRAGRRAHRRRHRRPPHCEAGENRRCGAHQGVPGRPRGASTNWRGHSSRASRVRRRGLRLGAGGRVGGGRQIGAAAARRHGAEMDRVAYQQAVVDSMEARRVDLQAPHGPHSVLPGAADQRLARG